MEKLALPPAANKKNYYVNLYFGEPIYQNRQLFIPFYGEEYASEADTKKAAIKEFLRSSGGIGLYNCVTLTEHNGMQIADKNEPYKSKSAIVRILASKNVPIRNNTQV